MSKTEPIASIMKITPALAVEWLKTSKGNRTINNDRLTRYASEMMQGRWMLNGEAIGFDEDLCLIDGHHRLHAIIRSGVTIESVVVMGLPPGAASTIDIGLSRTPGNVLQMVYQVPNAHAVAAIARAWCAIADDKPLNKFPDYPRWAELLQDASLLIPILETLRTSINSDRFKFYRQQYFGIENL